MAEEVEESATNEKSNRMLALSWSNGIYLAMIYKFHLYGLPTSVPSIAFAAGSSCVSVRRAETETWRDGGIHAAA